MRTVIKEIWPTSLLAIQSENSEYQMTPFRGNSNSELLLREEVCNCEIKTDTCHFANLGGMSMQKDAAST